MRCLEMTTSKRAYQLAERKCPWCGSTGPFLLDPSDDFTVSDDGQITFPPGEWGLDIDCDCPACGFAARLGDFCEWVEVTGEERMKAVRRSRESRGR
jgi:hypothetical protein